MLLLAGDIMNELDFYCTYVLIPLIKEYASIKSKKVVTKKEKKLLKEYETRINSCYKKLEEMIDESQEFYQILKECGILKP